VLLGLPSPSGLRFQFSSQRLDPRARHDGSDGCQLLAPATSGERAGPGHRRAKIGVRTLRHQLRFAHLGAAIDAAARYGRQFPVVYSSLSSSSAGR